LKLRWPATIAVFFRPDEAEKTMKTTGVFLYSRGKPFCGGSEAGDGRKVEIGWERERRRQEERESPRLRYGVNACMVHRSRWTLCAVVSRMKRSDGCDWLDLQVDRTVWMSGSLIWCGAVYRKLGTPDDVAQRDQILEYFKGWDVSRYIWYFSNCFFFKQYPTLVKKN
jgi:hypothetical protein